MDDPKLEYATVGMAEASLRLDCNSPECDTVEDRTAADVLRRKGFTPQRNERCFGYVPLPMEQESREGPGSAEPADTDGLPYSVRSPR